jgi:outer membrane immunogenic protein
MRRLLLVAAMLGAASVARAADMPDLPFLRGSFTEGLSTSNVNWGGAYIGGHVSHGAADMDFTNSGKDLLQKLLNNVDLESQFNISQWPIGGKAHMQSSGFGGFIGYNYQFTEAVIGVELNYTHGNFFGSSSGSQARSFQYPAGYLSSAAISSSSSMKLTDYGSLRGRAAYQIGNFLPYGFVGFGLAQANINRRADASLFYQYTGGAVPPLPNIGPTYHSLTDNAPSQFVVGFAAGAGIDIMLYAGLFLRAEYEHLRFSAKNVETSVNTVKAGLGYKF